MMTHNFKDNNNIHESDRPTVELSSSGSSSSRRRAQAGVCARCWQFSFITMASACVLATLALQAHLNPHQLGAEAASANRVNMHQVSRQTNQFYKRANSTGCPNKKWFDCGDNICVPSSLVCDRNRNCPNGNDEMIFYRCYSPLFWSIAASTALALMLVLLIVSVILIVRKRRLGRGQLNKMSSFSDNQLAAEADLIQHDGGDMSSKLDLTNGGGASRLGGGASYLANNMFLGGFENPVWTNGTLTKQQSQPSHHQQSFNYPQTPTTSTHHQQQQQQPNIR